jgi:3-deoxy-D-manno-octulosonic-acid transferase
LRCYVPYDLPHAVRRFLRTWRPSLGVVMETEVWPTLIDECRAADVPRVLTNARMSARSFKRAARFGAAAREVFGGFTRVLAQSPSDAERLTALGAARVIATGDLKLDVPAPAADPSALAALQEAIGARPLIAAASTHPGEDEHVLAAHKTLRAQNPGLLSIIAPRHPERGAQIAGLAHAAGLRFERRSSGALPDAATDVYIADTLGELGLLYRAAPLVFIGGSLVRHGGQNPIEPAKLGATVLHGPHVWNFADIYGALDAAQGAVPVTDADALTARFAVLIADPAQRASIGASGRAVVEALGGGLDRVLDALEPHLAELQKRDLLDA